MQFQNIYKALNTIYEMADKEVFKLSIDIEPQALSLRHYSYNDYCQIHTLLDTKVYHMVVTGWCHLFSIKSDRLVQVSIPSGILASY